MVACRAFVAPFIGLASWARAFVALLATGFRGSGGSDHQTDPFATEISRQVLAITDPVLSRQEIADLRIAMTEVAVDGRGGARNLLDRTEVRQLAAHPRCGRWQNPCWELRVLSSVRFC